jgi:hypothetical protein
MLVQIESGRTVTMKYTLLQPLPIRHSCSLISVGCRLGELQANSVVVALIVVESVLLRGDDVIGTTNNLG